MTPKQMFYEQEAAVIIKNLEKRGMEGYYCPDSESAVAMALNFMPESTSVSWGGSMTLEECGMMNALKSSKHKLIDRSLAKTPEETKAIYRQAFGADYYFMSSNAITLDGKLVNIDGTGNRVAALTYGPDHVILMVGMNKVAKDEAAAMERVHTMAAPPNAMRIGMKTPCGLTGVCSDCTSPDCICSQTSVIRYCRMKGRIKVILIGEVLGY